MSDFYLLWDQTQLEANYNRGKPMEKLWHGLSFILVIEEKEKLGPRN